MKKGFILSILCAFILFGCSGDQEIKGNNPNVIPAVENVDLNNPVIPVNAETAGEICLSEDAELKDVELTDVETTTPSSPNDSDSSGYGLLFLMGFLGGLVSLFTPCVFPMIPLTVSFFTKGGSETGKGFGKALVYGLSIVAVYVVLSLPFYASGTDPEILNEISTGFTLNIVFFVIFLVFAFSFFGYFELTLPAKWSNKADKASDIGGFFGIVFMALVLALVSFSCTGPLLGSVLAGSLKDGPVPITMAMLGFGVGLGLPFALFAAFPSILKKLPQSGGWLNTVKVVLGFVELGLALKFLSNADFVYRFGIVHRETFYLIWILIALATGAYLLGMFRFPHDSPNQKKSKIRLTFAALFLAFGIYLIPGVFPKDKQPWGTGLISGFPPSTWYSWYNNEVKGIEGISLEIEDEALRAQAEQIVVLDELIDFIVESNKDETKIHYHINDYEVGLALSKKSGKPMMLDFTGYACVNCRKMEEHVWGVDRVAELLEEYIIVSLYVDDKNELAPEDQGIVKISEDGKIITEDNPLSLSDSTVKEKKIIMVGTKWATFENMKFGNAAQPWYALLSPEEYLLTHCVGYTPDPSAYANWLCAGLRGMEKVEAGEYNFTKDTSTDQSTYQEVDYHVDWEYAVEQRSDSIIELTINGTIDEGWHTYSQFLTGFDGPLPTMITFEESDDFELVGDIVEENTHTYFDSVWDCEIIEFTDNAIFKASLKRASMEAFTLNGTISFMVCENGQCLPPTDQTFEIKIAE